MPRLLYFVICQKASFDRDDGSLSMLGVVNGISLVIIPGNPPAEVSVTPFRWSAVSGWLREPADEGKTYEQRIIIIPPVGQIQGEAEIPFTMANKYHNNRIDGEVFPAGIPGQYDVVLMLREQDAGQEWQELTRYPIDLIHLERPRG